jgi:hypothetical protein
MRGFHLNFERGFALHYPEAMGTERGMVFVLFKSGGRNAWSAYLDANSDVALNDVQSPPCLHTPMTGAIARCWHAHLLEAVLGFALERAPEGFTGGCERTPGGWRVRDLYGRGIALEETGGWPDTWEETDEIDA